MFSCARTLVRMRKCTHVVGAARVPAHNARLCCRMAHVQDEGFVRATMDTDSLPHTPASTHLELPPCLRKASAAGIMADMKFVASRALRAQLCTRILISHALLLAAQLTCACACFPPLRLQNVQRHAG